MSLFNMTAAAAKKAGLEWVELKVRSADGARHELKGPFGPARALELWKLASQGDDAELAEALRRRRAAP